MRLIPILFAFCMVAAAQAVPNADRDAKLIAEGKSIPVHKLDETLPELAFEKWLQKESGPDARHHWEVNDCGEQTGSPTDTGPVPLCVEVDSTLKDGRAIVIFVANDQPNRDAPPDWKIFFAQVVTPREKITLRRLSDLPVALTKTRKPTDPETEK